MRRVPGEEMHVEVCYSDFTVTFTCLGNLIYYQRSVTQYNLCRFQSNYGTWCLVKKKKKKNIYCLNLSISNVLTYWVAVPIVQTLRLWPNGLKMCVQRHILLFSRESMLNRRSCQTPNEALNNLTWLQTQSAGVNKIAPMPFIAALSLLLCFWTETLQSNAFKSWRILITVIILGPNIHACNEKLRCGFK